MHAYRSNIVSIHDAVRYLDFGAVQAKFSMPNICMVICVFTCTSLRACASTYSIRIQAAKQYNAINPKIYLVLLQLG